MLALAYRLLAKYGGLNGLGRAPFTDLAEEHGLGEAKASTLKAAFELGRCLALTAPTIGYRSDTQCARIGFTIVVRIRDGKAERRADNFFAVAQNRISVPVTT